MEASLEPSQDGGVIDELTVISNGLFKEKYVMDSQFSASLTET